MSGEVFCNQCGHRNAAGSNFCATCGGSLVGTSDDLTVTLHATEFDALDHDVAVHLDGSGPAVLVVSRGPEAGETYLLSADSTVAGRSPDADVFLDDVTVSRRHATFARRHDGSYLARDLGSLNGTYVNKARITEVELAPGDEVQIGKFRLVFLSSGERRPPGERVASPTSGGPGRPVPDVR